MSGDLRTDDDIARLFAEANPIPNRDVHRTAGRETPPTSPARGSTLVDLDTPPAERERPHHRYPWWVLGAAAVLALVVGLAFVVLDNDTTPADESGTPSTITTPDSLFVVAEPLTSGPLFDLVESFNTRDADGLRAALSDDAAPETVEEVLDIADDLPWSEAFDWRLTDIMCRRPRPDSVSCDAVSRNRLTDYTGVTITTELVAVIGPGGIEQIAMTEDFAEYGRMALDPFREYVAATHPDDFSLMWNDGPDDLLDIIDRAALFDSYLTEYTADPEPPTLLHRAFFDAHGMFAPERPDVAGMFTPDATIGGAWADDPAGYADGLEVLAALDFDWGDEACSVRGPSVGISLRCDTRPTTRLTEAGLAIRGQSVFVGIGADGIESFATTSISRSIDSALAPFYDWMVEEHPADANLLLTEVDDQLRLVTDPEGADRLAELVDEYVATFDGPDAGG